MIDQTIQRSSDWEIERPSDRVTERPSDRAIERSSSHYQLLESFERNLFRTRQILENGSTLVEAENKQNENNLHKVSRIPINNYRNIKVGRRSKIWFHDFFFFYLKKKTFTKKHVFTKKKVFTKIMFSPKKIGPNE